MLNSLIQFASSEAATTDASHEAAEATGVAVLGIDPLAIALQAGTFLLLFFIIRKFALAKIVKNLEDRRVTIEEGLSNAHEMEQKKVELEQQNEQIAKSARKQADDVIGKSHEEAGAIVAEAQMKATKQADDIVEKAKAQAADEKNKARKELKSELLGLVAEATETVLDEKIDLKKDKNLIENSLKNSARA